MKVWELIQALCCYPAGYEVMMQVSNIESSLGHVDGPLDTDLSGEGDLWLVANTDCIKVMNGDDDFELASHFGAPEFGIRKTGGNQ